MLMNLLQMEVEILAIDDNGTERVRITSAGNFGVGDYSSTNLTHAFQALRTSGNTYVSSKNTGGNALFYAEASSGNTAKLELMQATQLVILPLRLVVLMR